MSRQASRLGAKRLNHPVAFFCPRLVAQGNVPLLRGRVRHSGRPRKYISFRTCRSVHTDMALAACRSRDIGRPGQVWACWRGATHRLDPPLLFGTVQNSGLCNLSWEERRRKVLQYRNAHLLALQKQQRHKTYRQVRKNYNQTVAYVHLTNSERRNVVHEVAATVADWRFARLFAECIDKVHFYPDKGKGAISEQAFEQIVSRFETYLQKTDSGAQGRNYGLLVHDNNETVARKHTEMMRTFHAKGTVWTNVERIIETPLFVDSRLTTMVQVADLCSYALRRYLENGERTLFDAIIARADRIRSTMVGVRHFTNMRCACDICQAHRR